MESKQPKWLADQKAAIDALKLKLQQKEAALEARQAAARAKMKTAMTPAERRADARRKIIIGAAVLAEISRNGRSASALRTAVDRLITDTKDRAAVGIFSNAVSPEAQHATADPQVSMQAAEHPTAEVSST